MKNLYLGICLLLCGHILLAQNENNHWQLGPLDLNFSTNPNTVNTVTGIADNSNYGLASISDTNGNLLFYTDGVNVWNKNHQVMPNGTIGYTDNSQIFQKIVIIPHPGNSMLYYIFRHQKFSFSGNFDESIGNYCYSTIDFSNNSLGEVLNVPGSPYLYGHSTYLVDNNNQPLEHKPHYSPITSVVDSSGSNYWLIVQDENRMLSYRISTSGFNPNPVISTFAANQIYNHGYAFSENVDYYKGIDRSMIRMAPNAASPGNLKLYGLESTRINPISNDPANFNQNFYSLNFNNSTGQFSGFQQILVEGNGGLSYNFEFSEDFTKAYFVKIKQPFLTGTQDGEIIVKDLNSLSTPARLLYELVNTATASSKFSYLQKDKYGNLLVSSTYTDLNRNKYLHKIENSNSFSSSSVKINHIYLNNKSISVLPQLIAQDVRQCAENITLSTTETNTSFTYAAANTITTNNSYAVNSGSNIVLQAENAIFLNPNTEIKSGAVFEARIDECPYSNNLFDRRSIVSSNQDSENIAQADNQKSVTFLQLYPNPSNQSTKISLKNDMIKTLIISSMEGLTMFNRDIMKNSYDLYVGNYRKGIYIVTVQTVNGEIYTEKLMKN